MSLRIATFNMENLFTRPKVMNFDSWKQGKPALEAYSKLTTLMAKDSYTQADQEKMAEIIQQFGTGKDKAFTLVEVRGKLYSTTKKQVTVSGRADWIGWVELVRGDIVWDATENTGRVVQAIAADILLVVEVEDRTTLERFNDEVLARLECAYPHSLLVDGNDDRGIDVGLLSKYPIRSVRPHFDDTDDVGVIFSRDCPEFEVELPGGRTLWMLGNHFKSKGYGSPAASNAKRLRQAERAREIYTRARGSSEFVVLAGDLNDSPDSNAIQALTAGVDMQDAMSHPVYAEKQGKPGTYQTGNSLKQKIDYLFLSPALWASVGDVDVERRGVWAPKTHQSFPEVTSSTTQASDHGALWVELSI